MTRISVSGLFSKKTAKICENAYEGGIIPLERLMIETDAPSWASMVTKIRLQAYLESDGYCPGSERNVQSLGGKRDTRK